jgi:hypothetical protein
LKLAPSSKAAFQKLLVSVAQAQNLKSNIPYADPAFERQVLEVYSPDNAVM